MKRHITRILFFVLLALLTLGLGAASTLPALAQACTSTLGNACIANIDPTIVDGTKTNVFEIGGDGFSDTNSVGSISIVFDGSAALTFPAQKIDDETLRVTVPAGRLTAPSGYSYTVTAQASSGTISGLLTVVSEPTATTQPTAFARPLVVVLNYGPSSSPLAPGQTFDLEVNLINTGQMTATNVVVTFFPGDFEPRQTGGIRVVGNMDPGATAKVIQNFTAKSDLATGLAILDAEIRYTNVSGESFTEKARLTLDVKKPASGGSGPSATSTPTPTPGAAQRPQFVIAGYSTDVVPLKPGTVFNLALEIVNRGTAPAKSVSMIIGGGSAADNGGTPGAGGGVSGGGGEFTNFAPINSSNVQVLGDVPTGGSINATQPLIVNSTTTPGAYSLKISFVYTDAKNATYTDDQVITLLVLQPPRIEVSFYIPPDPLFVGQMGNLPIQVVNLASASTVLGTMSVTADSAELLNNTLLVGNLEPGFPVTLDTQIIPSAPGPLTLNITIEYTDNFNQPQVIEKSLQIEVIDAPIIDPGMEGGGEFPIEEPPIQEPATFWEMLLRFFKGLFGLGSGPTQPSGNEFPIEEMPIEEFPSDGGGPVIQPIAPSGPKG